MAARKGGPAGSPPKLPLEGAQLLASLDRHYAMGSQYLNSAQLAQHRLGARCTACDALEQAHRGGQAIRTAMEAAQRNGVVGGMVPL